MVQYLDRGTKFDLSAARHTLHKKRKKAGQIVKITDKDLLRHLEEGQGYLGHKGILEHRLKKSWRVHQNGNGCFRLLESGLVAVTNPADKTVITILTQEMAQKKVPFDLTLAFEVYTASLTAQSLNSQSTNIPIEGTGTGDDEMTGIFTNVTKDSFDSYPGQKRCEGEGSNLVYQVRNDEDRPLSAKQREFTDKLLELFKETGLSDQLALGGLQAQLALSTIAAATVTATDESLPQYARAAVTSLAQEVGKQAHHAKCWNVGAVASMRNHTVVQVREAEAEATISLKM
ncbi:hypothetical protein [Rhizobium sp. MHM7A]|uniref:hypothetical protein n=1 Tax=Rhizobium sp. MHM7A TaxID=2583233 RepID=UPI0011075022|nr:hypothetical protein [Rhizobium sp. MHM7A]TLX16207.1 hypothetical protein FFR93_02450 [Rhizobium sp. MHM7A]